MMGGRGVFAALVVSDAVLLWLMHPEAARACCELAAPREWLLREGADQVAVTVAAAGLWCVAAWVGLGLLAAVAARLPGAAGRAASRFVSVALPVVLQRFVVGSAGLGIVLAPITAAGMAAADVPDGPGGRPVAAAPDSAGGTPLPGPSWPGSGDEPSGAAPAWPAQPSSAQPPTSTPDPIAPGPRSVQPRPSASASAGRPATPGPSWPAPSDSPARPPAPASGAGSSQDPAARPPASPSPPVAPDRPTPPTHTTTVHPDDSLWLLGARQLGSHANDAEIAAYLPDLYRTNRDVIGDDPDLIRPGQQLTLPAPDSATRAPGANPP